MSEETLYTDTNKPAPGLVRLYKIEILAVEIGWVGVLVALFWAPALIAPMVAIAVTAVIYLILVVFGAKVDPSSPPFKFTDFFSLPGVLSMFKSPRAASAGWTHILAVDLFMGMMIALDVRAGDVSLILAVPALVLCFLFGPSGLLLYAVLRIGIYGLPDPLNVF